MFIVKVIGSYGFQRNGDRRQSKLSLSEFLTMREIAAYYMCVHIIGGILYEY